MAQLRRIATAVEVLPEVRDHMDKLDTHVGEMSAEVTRMREGVERLETAVGSLNGSVEGLDEQFVGMRGEMRGIDTHLDDVKKTLQPLRALAGVGGGLGKRLRG